MKNVIAIIITLLGLQASVAADPARIIEAKEIITDNVVNRKSFDYLYSNYSPEEYLSAFIDLVANSEDIIVRKRSAQDLSSIFTDNGSPGYQYLDILEKNINTLLIGLYKIDPEETLSIRHIVEILGGRYIGNIFGPCSMSRDNKEKIVSELYKKMSQLNSIDYSKRTRKQQYTIQDIEQALSNIQSCEK